MPSSKITYTNDVPKKLYPRTVWAPGSLAPSLTVGATDKDDLVALFASRGPSPWGEVKPEISAPGVRIVSSAPGGGLAEKQGTSMAAPHFAGILLQGASTNDGTVSGDRDSNPDVIRIVQ